MLEKTFLHVPGIGQETERRLWRQGITDWGEALARPEPPRGFAADRWQLVRDFAADSQGSLERLEHRYFAGLLPATHHWRAVPAFRRHIAYVDIETDGGMGPQSITVVGIYDGQRVRSYVKGENLAEAAEELQRHSLLVTFNGSTFDLPLLRRAFPRVDWSHLHVDLRYALGQLGLKGGLKQIEKEVGLQRQGVIQGLGGDDAIWLWQAYRRGDRGALETLLAYNAADIENLEVLLDMAWPQLRERAEGAAPA